MAKRGFGSMDEQKQKKVASEGGSASGGNLTNDPERASEMGQEGAKAQPTEAKSLGGRRSRRQT